MYYTNWFCELAISKNQGSPHGLYLDHCQCKVHRSHY